MQAPGPMIDKRSVIFFCSPSEMATKTLFYPISAGEFHCMPNYSIIRGKGKNEIESFLFLYTISGQGCLHYEGKTYKANKDELILVNCYKPHRYYAIEDWHMIWLHFDGRTMSDIFYWIYSQLGCVLPMGHTKKTKKILSLLLRGLSSPSRPPEALMSLFIHSIVTEMLALLPDSKPHSSLNNAYVAKAISYIEANLADKLTLTNIASNLNLSQYHFSRLFKSETGFTPHRFITVQRMDRAKIMLRTTNFKLKKIAEQIGIHSETNFIILFQKMTGFTPTEYRKMYF